MAVGRRFVVVLLLAAAVAVAAYALFTPREVEGPAIDRAASVPAEANGPRLGGHTEEEAKALRERRAAAWRAALEAAEPVDRRVALGRWDRSGLEASEAAAAIVPLLADVDPELRRAAKATLVAIGAPAVDALLRVGLSSSDWEVPALAIEALGALAQAGAGGVATNALLGLLGDAAGRRTWRQHAAMALGQIRPVEERVCAALLAAVADPSDEVASAAVDGIGNLGAAGEPLVHRLLDILEGREKGPRSDVAVALSRIGRRGDLVVPGLLRLGDWRVVPDAVAAFGRDALPAVKAALSDPSPAVLSMAYQALVKLGATGAPLAPTVVEAVERHPESAWIGCEALRAMGPAARTVVPDLRRLAATNEEEPHAFARALGAMGVDGETALRGLLEDGRDAVRHAACSAFGERREAGEESRARLAVLAEGDRADFVRRGAAWALQRMASR